MKNGSRRRQLTPVNWISEGERAGLVRLSADGKCIEYFHHSSLEVAKRKIESRIVG